MPISELRVLYHRSIWRFYDLDQKIISPGQACDRLYVITSGVVEVSLSKGYQTTQLLDLMGRGSIIGAQSILCKDDWALDVTVRSVATAQVLEIPSLTILSLARGSPSFLKAVEEDMLRVEMMGTPQIDYIIFLEKFTKGVACAILESVRQNRLWREGLTSEAEETDIKATQAEKSDL